MSKNIKLGNTTLNGVDQIQVVDADNTSIYDAFNLSHSLTITNVNGSGHYYVDTTGTTHSIHSTGVFNNVVVLFINTSSGFYYNKTSGTDYTIFDSNGKTGYILLSDSVGEIIIAN